MKLNKLYTLFLTTGVFFITYAQVWIGTNNNFRETTGLYLEEQLNDTVQKSFLYSLLDYKAGSLLVIIIGVVIILLYRKNRELEQVIKKLHETANIQIFLMGEFESKVRKEEQERISQSLHDDLAGTLVAIKNNVDLEMLEAGEEGKKRLKQLSVMIENAFHNVRNKSHELFEAAHLPDEEMFRQHITQLIQIAFPSKYYTLNVQVDDYALKNTSIELRSELIRVVQEAFTNIIKHAKATQVDLLIYKENEKLFVIIKDNGRGFTERNNKKTLGLYTMQNRLKKFNVDFSIHGNENGTEVVISIPEEADV